MTGQPRQYRHDKTVIAGQLSRRVMVTEPLQDSKAGQPRQTCYGRTAMTFELLQNDHSRTAITGKPRQDSYHRIAMTGQT
jgi:hypothetical protein